MSLYIGTNYHPHDWPSYRWATDVKIVKDAGFNMVRLGHLCWDSYEPADGNFTFEWFDIVMNLFLDAGIKVILDVATRPAPRWVHIRCPGCDIYGSSNTRQDSLTRYMEDVDDPAYQRYAFRFARQLAERYKDHPSLFAFALDNELGSGYPSYSPAATARFRVWLQNKYGNIQDLNQAWQTQRWSRRVNSFEEITLQENSISQGMPSAWLDMRRFFSDGIGNFLLKLSAEVRSAAPGVPQTTNHYSDHKFGFDFGKFAGSLNVNPGVAHYPEYLPGDSDRLKGASFYQMHRLWEYSGPMWILEFQSGTGNNPQGPYGLDRMHAFVFLLYRTQMVLGWTWRTMLAGEEQFLYGILGHDGIPTQNYQEYKALAADFKKLEQYALPYLPNPQIAIAYNYENKMVAFRQPRQFDNKDYTDKVREALVFLDIKNYDYNVVDIRNIQNSYKVLIVPAYYLMEEKAAENLRNFVSQGGTLVMTGFSSMLDKTNAAFSTSRPGLLDDVFGIRVATFTRTNVDWNHEDIVIARNGASVKSGSAFYETLELKSASSYAQFQGKNLCAVSVNTFGAGKAYYIAVDSDNPTFSFLLPEILSAAGIETPFSVPDGVRARKLAAGQHFFVNTNDKAVTITLPENGTGVLTGKSYSGTLTLPPFEAELIVS
ncbi:MAG: beta-galactosidase [Clostridiales bacterium]|jgi:beta-galactosidase|nr:beta-galactosidase [Clostridiales bacterium]